MLVPLDQKNPVWVGVFVSEDKRYDIFRVVRGQIAVGKKTDYQMSIDDSQSGMILCQEAVITQSTYLHSFAEFQIKENTQAFLARSRKEVVAWIRKKIFGKSNPSQPIVQLPPASD